MGRRTKSQAEQLSAKAFKLLSEGMSLDEVAKSLNVSLRTVQRWNAARKNPKPKPEIELATEGKFTCLNRRLSEVVYLEYPDFLLSDSHKKIFEKHLRKNYELHNQLAENFYFKLTEELGNPSGNLRNANQLSLSFIRHCDEVYRSLFFGKESPKNHHSLMSYLKKYGITSMFCDVVLEYIPEISKPDYYPEDSLEVAVKDSFLREAKIQKWASLVEMNALHFLAINNQIVQETNQKLKEGLIGDDIPARNLNLLSLILTRHSNAINANIFMHNDSTQDRSQAIALLATCGCITLEVPDAAPVI